MPRLDCKRGAPHYEFETQLWSILFCEIIATVGLSS
jgi:hypothetical protein